MFGDDDEPETISSMVDSGDLDDEPDLIDPDELDDLPDPDPIPQVFTSSESGDDENGEPVKRSLGKIIGIAVGAVIVAFLVAAVVLKDTVVGMIPATAGIYDMIGLGGEELGAGLAIQKVKSARETEQGQEVLVVRGIVTNVSEIERRVPIIKVLLFDGEGHAIQDALAAALKNKLAPKASVSFKARLVEPSPLARRLEVTFAEAAQGEHGEKKAH